MFLGRGSSTTAKKLKLARCSLGFVLGGLASYFLPARLFLTAFTRLTTFTGL